jgi:N-acetylglucosamine kinase-like BadF-type ATPase
MTRAAADLLVGLDIGGTKTHIRVTRGDTVVADAVLPSDGWSATPVGAAAQWVSGHIGKVVGELDCAGPALAAAVAVGAQGCEEPEHCAQLKAALEERLAVPVTVVNDAELLLPAAGLVRGIALIGGTGAIAIRSDGAGNVLRAGGWGWVLSDDGSASALVRDAARAVLSDADRGGPPGTLAERLLASVGVPGIPELALTLSWGDGPEHWGRHAPAVVAAAEEGDADARAILSAGARSLAALVDTLTARVGGTPEPVVAAGGLLTAVPAYWSAVEFRLRAVHPDRDIRLLSTPPVTGALALARGLTRPS